MYTIQFGQRAHFLNDESAQIVKDAIRDQRSFVTVSIDLAADGGEQYEVMLNTAHIVALIRHRAEVASPRADDSRPKLVLVS
jgi:hypothetical protein